MSGWIMLRPCGHVCLCREAARLPEVPAEGAGVLSCVPVAGNAARPLPAHIKPSTVLLLSGGFARATTDSKAHVPGLE